MARRNYYAELSADYSRPGLVSESKRAELIALGEKFIGLKEDGPLPAIDASYTSEQIQAENMQWWPTHCEALRQGRGDILTKEYREDLVYHCGDGPYYGIKEQQQREKHWWAIIAQPGVTMCWPIVQFHSEFTHFEWQCLDDATGETIAKGSVCWVRRGHRGACHYKSEQLTFVRDVFASQHLLDLIKV